MLFLGFLPLDGGNNLELGKVFSYQVGMSGVDRTFCHQLNSNSWLLNLNSLESEQLSHNKSKDETAFYLVDGKNAKEHC